MNKITISSLIIASIILSKRSSCFAFATQCVENFPPSVYQVKTTRENSVCVFLLNVEVNLMCTMNQQIKIASIVVFLSLSNMRCILEINKLIFILIINIEHVSNVVRCLLCGFAHDSGVFLFKVFQC